MNSYHLFKGRKVTIMCCSDCNVKCSHCYISYKGNFSGNNLEECAKGLVEKGYKVALNGSEILLHEEYLRTFRVVGQTRVMTNGLVFKDNYSYLDLLKSYGISTYNISYHFDLHDLISPVPMEYLHLLFKEITQRGLKFTINCTISTQNMTKICDYCREAYSLGACRIRFTNLLNVGMAVDLDRKLFLEGTQILEVLDRIKECRGWFDKDEFYIERCGSFGVGNDKSKFRCTAGIDEVYITPDMKVYPCPFLTKRSNEIGFFSNGNVFIHNDYVNNQEKCMAHSKLNGFSQI